MRDWIYEGEVVQLIREYVSKGLTRKEIAQRLGFTYDCVIDICKKFNIPKADRRDRLDKVYICQRCGREVVIPRKERVKKYCPECRQEVRRLKARKV